MKYLKRFVLMIQFLTRIPINLELQVTNEDFGRGLIFAPVVGGIIGAVMMLAYYVSGLFLPLEAAVLLALVTYIAMTGGLHLDGLGDTCDGIFSNRPKERILEIMRDSRIGTNALLAVLSVLLLNFVLLKNVPQEYMYTVLFLFPVAGRIGSLISSGISTYARKTDGLGKSFIDICGTKEIITGSIMYFVIFGIAGGKMGLLFSVLPYLGAYCVTRFFTRKIDGATGDILGAVCEINQTVFLLGVFLALRIAG